jgi:hypothetical protein
MDSSVRSKHFFQHSLLVGFAIISFLIAGIINQRTPKPELNLDKQETALNINKDLLIFLSAGNKRLITDLLWVQTLIESDLEHYAARDLKSWMFLRFFTISTLDPYFYENYVWGGQFLSIVKDDLLGAVKLMERGIQFYPDDYRLNYNLGFTYYFELGDYKKGVVFLEKVKNHPKAPHFIHSLIMKMKIETGFDYNIVLSLIYDLMMGTPDEALKTKLSADFHSLKAERDLICLNSGKTDCETLDAYGVPYVKIFGKFHSQTPFIPYRLKKKGDHKKTQPVTTIE